MFALLFILTYFGILYLGIIALAHRQLLNKVVWPHFWFIQIWLLVLFFLYCTMRELIRVLGRERVRAMFFGPPTSHPV